mmetsp:Transcript_33212/g.61704  ORF Transcript_33212/g.61704 Transcript_33212/m.61704 type:complete len:283 (-) Transcript_33212:220-1068(-)
MGAHASSGSALQQQDCGIDRLESRGLFYKEATEAEIWRPSLAPKCSRSRFGTPPRTLRSLSPVCPSRNGPPRMIQRAQMTRTKYCSSEYLRMRRDGPGLASSLENQNANSVGKVATPAKSQSPESQNPELVHPFKTVATTRMRKGLGTCNAEKTGGMENTSLPPLLLDETHTPDASEPQAPRMRYVPDICKDPFNWVSDNTIWDRKVTIFDAATNATEDMAVRSNDKIGTVRKAYVAQSKCPDVQFYIFVDETWIGLDDNRELCEYPILEDTPIMASSDGVY